MMAAKGKTHSAATRARIAAGTRRALARKRERERLRPAHVDRWLQKGAVCAELAPIARARALQVEAMIQDLGGADEVTQMQRAVLDGWLEAQVAADAEFARFVRDGDRTALERIATFLNTARASLTALGLHRRARELDPMAPVKVEWSNPGGQGEGEAPAGEGTTGVSSSSEVAQ